MHGHSDKVSRAIAKRKGQFLSFPKNLAATKRKFYDVALFSLFSFLLLTSVSLFKTLPTFHDDVSHAPFWTPGVSAVSGILEDD